MKKIYCIVMILIFSLLLSFNCLADSYDNINLKSNCKIDLLIDLEENNDYEIGIVFKNTDTNKIFEVKRTYKTRNNPVIFTKGNYKIDSIKQYINDREKTISYEIVDNISTKNICLLKLKIHNKYSAPSVKKIVIYSVCASCSIIIMFLLFNKLIGKKKSFHYNLPNIFNQ